MRCLYCDEDVSDVAVQPVAMTAIGPVRRLAHRECQLRELVGGPAHVLGSCGGSDDPDMGMTPREAAVWVWNYYRETWKDETGQGG